MDVQRLGVRQPSRRSGRLLVGGRQDDVGGREHSASGVCETDVERAKRKLRERRATLVLGIVMLSFVGCWLPFFTVYPISLLTGLTTITASLRTAAPRC